MGGDQFDGERQAIEPAAQLGHRTSVGRVEPERRLGRRRVLDEERDSRRGAEIVDGVDVVRHGFGYRERGQRVLVFPRSRITCRLVINR